MKTLLIYGVDTVAGANFANTLSDRYTVIGVADGFPVEVSHCHLVSGQAATDNPKKLLADLSPDLVIDASCCGDSAWNSAATIGSAEQATRSLSRATACGTLGLAFTFLSSDAVLTGPWMFHEEDSTEVCQSVLGQRLRQLEQAIEQACPAALIVRSHPFGWCAQTNSETVGWIEQMLANIGQQSHPSQWNQPGHATPILASELAELLHQAFAAGLTGLHHIGGAERVNRVEFVRRLAEACGIRNFRIPMLDEHYTRAERQSFANGESSLQTRRIRRRLSVPVPALTESLTQLMLQRSNGYMSRLCGPVVQNSARAA